MPRRISINDVRWLDRFSPTQALLLGYGSLVALALLDYATSVDVSFSIFYLIPVMIVAWGSSLRASILMSFIAATLWEWVDLVTGEGSPPAWVQFWNPASKLATYLLVSFLLRKLRSKYEELSTLSRTDSLTGVANRRAFLESMEIELTRHCRSGQPLSLAFIDLDRFKQVNDTLGHEAGDRALRIAAEVLSTPLRRTDVIGRLGGDEFAVLMPETSGEGAQVALGAAVGRMTEEMAKLAMPVTFSVGVVTVGGQVRADRLLQQADTLMYEVKREGGNDLRQRDFREG